jgi:exopolysaccharide biosynthesis polyprenyl glycosylphosphotransferase
MLEILQQHNVKKVILAISHTRCSPEVMETLLKARLNGISIIEMVEEYEELTTRIPVHHIHDHWIVMEQGFKLYSHELTNKIKRLIDVVLSILGLVVLAIPMVLTAIIVKLESKGPAIFKQKRVGLNEKEFTLYKFRSMCQDAEKDGAVWAQKGDVRVTRFGRFIRKVRLDELPQLWNILKGDMSLIGPRPERMVFVKELEKELPYYYLRHTVKPGLTGWAQVNYPYGATKEDALNKLEYELYYIKNMSLMLDIKIILKTIGVMCFGDGAR